MRNTKTRFGCILGLVGVLVPLMATPSRSEEPAQQLPASLAGVYRHDFANGLADGTKYRSENVLTILPRSATEAYFHAHLEFFNGHLCEIDGIADWHGDTLVYHGPDSVTGAACVLRLQVADGLIRLADPKGGCRADTCGARGQYDGVTFALSSRRTLPNEAALRGSTGYEDAVRRHRATTVPAD
jgi:hypothetical protein